MSVNRLLNYANKYYYVRRERKSWDPPITVDNSREKISDRSKEKRADETKQWGYDREREKEGRMDELKKWGYQVDGLGESMASAEACAEAASPSDCIISFSSLAHRRFRTEVIEPLLAVPLVKGKKKNKIPKATTKATGAPLPKGRLARAVEELLKSEGGDEAEKVRLIRDLAAVLRLVGVRPEHPLRQHLDILAQCISTKLKHGMRVFPL
jgi:hypothetical protein